MTLKVHEMDPTEAKWREKRPQRSSWQGTCAKVTKDAMKITPLTRCQVSQKWACRTLIPTGPKQKVKYKEVKDDFTWDV